MDVAVIEKVRVLIVEICELIVEYRQTGHGYYTPIERVSNAMDYMMTPALDEYNAEKYFRDRCVDFIFAGNPIISAIGVKMNRVGNLFGITDRWGGEVNLLSETEWFVAYYAHHARAMNNMQE